MNRYAWLVVLFASTLSLTLLLGGFVLSLLEVTDSPPSDVQKSTRSDPPKGTTDSGTVSLVALGDSLTRGIGDASGGGYVGRLKEALESEGPRVAVHNHAVNGMTLSELLAQLRQKDIRRTLADASLITVTIGGNDLFHHGEFLESWDPHEMNHIKEIAVDQIEELFDAMRAINREAPLIYIGLYNPFPDLEKATAYAKIVHEWNHEVSLKASDYDHVVVVPTFDLIRDAQQDLASDHFHPNERSYKRIAARVAEVLNGSL